MDLLFENFGFLLIIGVALASWLKSRIEAKQEEQAERRAREEMARHFEELEDRPIRKAPPPVPRQREVNPRQTESPKPPPLREIFREIIESAAGPPPFMSTDNRDQNDRAYDNEPAPWESFQHSDASQSEIQDLDHDPLESPMLKRQREMQERLVEIKKEAAQYKGKVAGARETQRRIARKNQPEEALVPLGSLRSTLKDKRQVRRAIILREILDQPVGLRPASQKLR